MIYGGGGGGGGEPANTTSTVRQIRERGDVCKSLRSLDLYINDWLIPEKIRSRLEQIVLINSYFNNNGYRSSTTVRFTIALQCSSF